MAEHKQHDRRTDDEWRIQIDKDVRGVIEKQAGIAQSIKSLAGSFDRLRDSVDRIMKERFDAQKTPWGIIIAGLMLVAVIIGGLSSGYVRDLGRLERATDEGIARMHAHIEDGHPRRVEYQVLQNNEKIDNLDKTLRREMNLSIDAIDIKVKASNERLRKLESLHIQEKYRQ